MTLTAPQRKALDILATKPRSYEWAAGEFANLMWPDRYHQRINGPRGLGPTGAPMAGGRMLTRLQRMGLVGYVDHYGFTRYVLTAAGAAQDTPEDQR